MSLHTNAPCTVSSELVSPPRNSPSTLKGVLISEDSLRDRITQLAQTLNQDYGNQRIVVVGVLSGTILFLADLIRQLTGPVEIDFIGVSSYRDGTSPGEAAITRSLKTDLKDRHVLIVDDILDVGQTLTSVVEKISTQQPKDLRTCVLLEKTARRRLPITADYVGFSIPDYFVVGYGLDYAEQYRNLPYVAVLDETQLGQKG